MAAACFVPCDAGDEIAVKRRLEHLGYSGDKMEELLQKAKVRRIIPDKVTLSNRVTAVMLEYKHITDPVHHVPLLNEQAWHAFHNNLDKVQDDLLSGMPQNSYAYVIDCSSACL